MDYGIYYAEVGRKQRIGDIMPDAMPFRDRKPSVDMHMQVGHIRATISTDADLCTSTTPATLRASASTAADLPPISASTSS